MQNESEPNQAPALELTASVRSLIERVRTVDPDAAADIAAANELVRRADALLGPHVVEGPRMQAFLKSGEMMERFAEREASGSPAFFDGRPISDIFRYSPVVGPFNPISAPAHLHVRTGDPYHEIEGHGVFPTAHTGPPDSVHGGLVAAVLDEMLGAACMINDLGGFTGTLSIRYRSPTPINKEITLRSRVTGTERRKVFATGTMFDGETLLAEAEGIFIRSADLQQLPG